VKVEKFIKICHPAKYQSPALNADIVLVTLVVLTLVAMLALLMTGSLDRAVRLLISTIREIPDYNFDRNTDCPDRFFVGFLSALWALSSATPVYIKAD
jgi:hypothetical protein